MLTPKPLPSARWPAPVRVAAPPVKRLPDPQVALSVHRFVEACADARLAARLLLRRAR